MSDSVIDLTTRLVRVDTAGQNESDAIRLLAPMLTRAGFDVHTVPWQQGRDSLVADWNGGGSFLLSGHVDTVPYGDTVWSPHGPLSAFQDRGRLVGRGSSDMKGGVAAMVVAAIAASRRNVRGFTLALTSGEETGCGGAQRILEAGLIRQPEIVIVGESTSNTVRLGHKGATWFQLATTGISAHGSRPELGVNAIERIADAIVALRDVEVGSRHPQLGTRTVNVGTIAGGIAPNLVPDRAMMSADVRTVPGSPPQRIRDLLEEHGEVETVLQLDAVWSPAELSLSQAVVDVVARVTGRRDEPSGVSYFTDASVLDPTRCQSYIIGPGDLDQPHSTNESVSIALLEEAVSIYEHLLDAWNRETLR